MRSLVFGVALAALALPAMAQQNPNDRTARYPVSELNFDLWCQETEGLPPDRCDKRLPEDDAKFTAYRSNVERYEIPWLKSKDRAQNLNRVVIHNDPVPNESPVNQPTDKQIASPKPNP